QPFAILNCEYIFYRIARSTPLALGDRARPSREPDPKPQSRVIPPEAGSRAHPGTLWGTVACGRARHRAPLRGAEALGPRDALRPEARARRNAQKLGSAEGSLDEGGGEAIGRPRRGSSSGIRILRGDDPRGELRRGLG